MFRYYISTDMEYSKDSMVPEIATDTKQIT